MTQLEQEEKIIGEFVPCQVTYSMTCDRDPELQAKCGLDNSGQEKGCPHALNYLKKESLGLMSGRKMQLIFVEENHIKVTHDYGEHKSVRGVRRGSSYHTTKKTDGN